MMYLGSIILPVHIIGMELNLSHFPDEAVHMLGLVERMLVLCMWMQCLNCGRPWLTCPDVPTWYTVVLLQPDVD